MKKTVYACNHCGKETEDRVTTKVKTGVGRWDLDGTLNVMEDLDFCSPCASTLLNTLIEANPQRRENTMSSYIEAFCKTCRKDYTLGHGGGDGNKKREEDFPKQNHDGHDWEFYSSDYCRYKDGNLIFENPLNDDVDMVCEGISKFTHVDLEAHPREDWERVDKETPNGNI